MKERTGESGLEEGGAADPQGPGAADIRALYLQYGEELRRFVLGILKDPERASDVLQATFSKAMEESQAGRLRPLHMKGWLFRVACNEALVWRRRGGAEGRAYRKLSGIGSGGGEGPEGALIRGELVESVRRELEKLPAVEREVVRLRIYEDRTFAEIAEVLGVPIGTVLSRMRRAVGRLRGVFEKGELKP